MGYAFDIEYKPQLENKVADALSRLPMVVHLAHLAVPSLVDIDVVNQEVQNDPHLSLIVKRLQEDPDDTTQFSLQRGILKYKGRLVISKTSSLIPTILHTYHDSVLGGRSGSLRTYKRLTADLYWEGMKTDVKKYVEECLTCQENKTLAVSPAGLHQPLDVLTRIWEDITMDFIEGLPKSEGCDAILGVVDRLSKYGHFLALKHPFTAKSVAAKFIQEIVRLHGFPRSIISDRDKIFISHFWTELFRVQGTKLKRSTSYHLQTDGQMEIVNKCVEHFLRCFCYERPKKWSQWLGWAEYWYNTTFHISIGITPFQAVYRRPPPPLISYGEQSTINSTLEQQLLERDIALNVVQEKMRLAQERMKKFTDRNRREVEYKIGDMVFLKICLYRQASLAKKRNEKLSPKYYGPYRVLEKIGKVAFKLDLPENACIHPMFHVSQLEVSWKH